MTQEEFDKFSKEILEVSYDSFYTNVDLVTLADKYNLLFNSRDYDSMDSKAYQELNKDD